MSQEFLNRLNNVATLMHDAANQIRSYAGVNLVALRLAVRVDTECQNMRDYANEIRRERIKTRQRAQAKRRVSWCEKLVSSMMSRKELIQSASQLSRGTRRKIEADYKAFRALHPMQRFELMAKTAQQP